MQITHLGALCDLRSDVRSDEPNFRFRVEKIPNLALGHLVSANPNTSAAPQVEKKRIQ